jgi:hypothetical protein
MKAFHTIAIPHKDILEGKLTLDIFAADLHEVSLNKGVDEYRDADTFFKKTFLTQGLQNLLNIVDKRILGKGGDPVIQIQTPFGGGKTHSLIALYHKCKEKKVKTVVIVGEKLDPDSTIWSIIEKQLTGKVNKFKETVAPGGEALKELLLKNAPFVILMDEVLQYVTRAAGVKIGSSNLAAQTMAFMQALTETVSSIPNGCLLISLPSSVPEHYDQNAEKLYQQLQKVSGRLEKIYTPVEEGEITSIIRKRLFSEIDENEAKKIVDAFMEYSEKEAILPPGMFGTEYRDRFISSYPFLPDVVDILYQRWGTFPNFQRTRGVLRLLSIVIHSLKKSKNSYISLADFDLSIQELRQELLKHIGPEFNGVIASDLTGNQAGSKLVDESLGKAYQGLSLGLRSTTSIFMYSFSGGHIKGATTGEIKRAATTFDNPSAIIEAALSKLEKELFFLQSHGDKYFFSNQPNLNRIVLTQMENIKNAEVHLFEQDLLQDSIKGAPFSVYSWEDRPSNIPDNEQLKLVIIKKGNSYKIKEIISTKGQSPRVYRNTMFVLYPNEMEEGRLFDSIKRKIAYENIEKDKNLNLSEEQKKDIRKELKKLDNSLLENIRRYYRVVAIPTKDGYKTLDLGVPTYGDIKGLDIDVYDKLRNAEEILESVAPLILVNKYLSSNDYVSTYQIFQATLKTPGEFRPINRSVIIRSVQRGVEEGLFGLGELLNTEPKCYYFKQRADVALTENEIIISKDVAIKLKEAEKQAAEGHVRFDEPKIEGTKINDSTEAKIEVDNLLSSLNLKFTVPAGKVSNLMGIMNYLQQKFNKLELEINASNGSLTKQEYEDKIQEALNQIGIERK